MQGSTFMPHLHAHYCQEFLLSICKIQMAPHEVKFYPKFTSLLTYQ